MGCGSVLSLLVVVACNNKALGFSSMRVDPLEGLPSPLILGSGSFTRKLILQEMGVDFRVVKLSIDEKSIGDREKDEPASLVVALAEAKCDHLVASGDLPDCCVLTGDQVVTHNGAILEKPESIEEAKRFVAGYAKSPPKTVGSCVLTHVPSGIRVSGVDVATIHFRPSIADCDLVDRLLEDKAPILDCAGGLMIEHSLVKEHLERIDGTESSVMGLSKELVLRLLGELKQKLANS